MRAEAWIDGFEIVQTAAEQQRGRQQHKREGDLRSHESPAQPETPSGMPCSTIGPHGVCDIGARRVQRREQAKGESRDHAHEQRHQQHRRIGMSAQTALAHISAQ